jgi:hypothetical protein
MDRTAHPPEQRHVLVLGAGASRAHPAGLPDFSSLREAMPKPFQIGGRHPQTVRALPGVVEGLENRGFELVTVSALLGGRMIYPQPGLP